jgi:hypothetical protein
MKRNALSTAVLAGLTGLAGMVSVSHAVNVNPDGLGQVLLFPYYTARGGNNTLISVVNTTPQTKAVKVRFIEALNSREVLDFNLYLSPYDVWTAAVLPADGGGAKMITTDTSCTVPYFQGGVPGNVGEQEFLNFQYTGQNNDRGPQGIERTASGYIEIIEMGTLVDVAGFPAASAAKHVNGVPRSGPGFGTPCSVLNNAWAQGPWGFGFGSIGAPNTAMEPVSGGLFGGASIVNVRSGTLLSYNATAIDSFWPVGGIAHTDPGSVRPNLSEGDTTSRVFVNRTGTVMVDTQTWPTGGEAVNATLMFEELYNEYAVNADLAGRTEWVLTFPTKRFHTDDAPGGFRPINDPLPPFTQTWRSSAAANWAGGFACEPIGRRVWDREEREPATGIIVSPPPPVTGFAICREANVIRFSRGSARPDATEILGEPERPDFSTLTYTSFQLPAGFEEGWLKFDFASLGGGTRASRPALGTGDRYVGLPVVGFSASTITNGVLAGGTLSNYGGTFQHRGSRRVVSGQPVS